MTTHQFKQVCEIVKEKYSFLIFTDFFTASDTQSIHQCFQCPEWKPSTEDFQWFRDHNLTLSHLHFFAKWEPSEKMWLTNGGNLFRLHPGYAFGKYYFQKPDGEFIREVTDSHAKYLLEDCLEIEVSNPPTHPDFFPTWHFIKSVKVLDDFTDWHTDRCRNGGNYSFHTYHDWYVAQYPDGSWKFAYVECFDTSSTFSFDELYGNFQTDLGELHISNGMGCPTYSSQRGIEWTEEGKLYTSSEVLEKLGTISSFKDMWNEEYEFIPSEWDDEYDPDVPKQYGYTVNALTFTQKKEIITRLKELGVTKEKRPVRGQHRGRR